MAASVVSAPALSESTASLTLSASTASSSLSNYSTNESRSKLESVIDTTILFAQRLKSHATSYCILYKNIRYSQCGVDSFETYKIGAQTNENISATAKNALHFLVDLVPHFGNQEEYALKVMYNIMKEAIKFEYLYDVVFKFVRNLRENFTQACPGIWIVLFKRSLDFTPLYYQDLILEIHTAVLSVIDGNHTDTSLIQSAWIANYFCNDWLSFRFPLERGYRFM